MFPFSLARKGRTPFCGHILLIFVLAFSSRVTGGAQTLNEAIIYSFTNSPDGSYPSGGVILGRDGSLYGTTPFSGANGRGILFQLNRNGSSYHILYQFDLAGGAAPLGLLQGTNGFLYGAAGSGGSNSVGAVFSINTNGTGYKQLHAFAGTDGAYPSAALFQGSNTVLYGGTSQGGISNAGIVFRMNSDGSGFQVLHQCTNSLEGSSPSSVIQGLDGALYGTMSSGGISNAGVVFRLNTNGNNYTLLHTFTKTPDGYSPQGNLIQGKDGMLYGTTSFGGNVYAFGGTFFKIGTNGSGYVVLHNYPTIAGDGINPASLTQVSDGTLYGVAANGGGPSSTGMIFKSDTNGGNYAVVYDFTSSPPDGRNPVAPIIDGGDGALYGTADHGGGYDQGIVFRLAPPLALSMQSSNASGTNTSIFSWPAWAMDYSVHTSSNLTNTSWTTLGAPVTSGAKLFTTNKGTAPNAFFRLQTGP